MIDVKVDVPKIPPRNFSGKVRPFLAFDLSRNSLDHFPIRFKFLEEFCIGISRYGASPEFSPARPSDSSVIPEEYAGSHDRGDQDRSQQGWCLQ
jgi:hypothetical protein